MFILRKIGFFITLTTIVIGTLAVLLLLLLGVSMGNGDNVAGAIVGTVFTVIAIIALIVVGVTIITMIFYQKSIVVPILLFVVFALLTNAFTNSGSPVAYVTLGLTIGPLVTIIGYFFKKPQKDIPEQEQ